MQVEQAYLEAVENKLNQQNALKAALLVPLWCMPMLVAWYWVFHNYASAVPMFLLASGALIGLLVRIHGKGYTPLFSLLAFLSHLLLVVGGTLLGLLLGKGETIFAVILVGLYIGGAWSATFLARLRIPFLEQRAYYQLAEKNTHVSSKRKRNRWFVAVPLLCGLSAGSVFLTMLAVASFDQYLNYLKPYEAKQQKKDELERRAIDVTPASLEKISTKEALLHVYAYSWGERIDNRGYILHQYPRSDYKAQTILKYLVNERNDPRAKFLLGLFTLQQNGLGLIQKAADEGDIYAKIHIAADYACYDKPEIARDLLKRMLKSTRDKRALARVKRILAGGFGRFCDNADGSPVAAEFVIAS